MIKQSVSLFHENPLTLIVKSRLHQAIPTPPHPLRRHQQANPQKANLLKHQLHAIRSLDLSRLQQGVREEEDVKDSEAGGEQLNVSGMVLPSEKDESCENDHSEAVQFEAKSEVKVAAVEELVVRLNVVPAEQPLLHAELASLEVMRGFPGQVQSECAVHRKGKAE